MAFLSRIVNNGDVLKQGATMAKEEVKHRKDDKKKPALNPKEKKAKKAEKKQAKG